MSASELLADYKMQQIKLVCSVFPGSLRRKKMQPLYNSWCKSKNVGDYECKMSTQMHFPPPLCFPSALSVACGGLFIRAASSLFSPVLTDERHLPSVPLRSSTWGHGTSEQSSAATRPTSRSSRQWTACGSTWRRLTTTPFWRQDTCVCEIHTDSLTEGEKFLENKCFCLLLAIWC